MFSKKFDRRVYVALAVLLLSGTLGASFGTYVLWPSHRESGYEPSQPIPFSHEMHAGELQMDCLYCHSEADRGPQASVPGISVCMKCHDQVQTKNEDGTLTEGMATLLDHWEQKRPILWNKVNDVADFVYFDHSRHVNSGVDCEECHGPFDTMERVRREFGLKMSWCLDCHKEEPTEEHPAFARGDPTRAPINCTACHR